MSETNVWFYQIMGETLGPIPGAKLKELVEIGRIDCDTLVRKGKAGNWVAAINVRGLFAVSAVESASKSDSQENLKSEMRSDGQSVVDKQFDDELFKQTIEHLPNTRSSDFRDLPIKAEKTIPSSTTKAITSTPLLPKHPLEQLAFLVTRWVMVAFILIASLGMFGAALVLATNMRSVPQLKDLSFDLEANKQRIIAEHRERETEFERQIDGDDGRPKRRLNFVLHRQIIVPQKLQQLFSESLGIKYILESAYADFDAPQLELAISEMQRILEKLANDEKIKPSEIFSIVRAASSDQALQVTRWRIKESSRDAAFATAWTAFGASAASFLSTVLVLVLLAIERNTRHLRTEWSSRTIEHQG